MKIAVIGGGISGLYSANLLSETFGNDVEIYEGGQWGGDIQTTMIGNTCYPISTLFVMPGDNILRSELKKHNISNGVYWSPYNKYVIGILFLLFGISLSYSILYDPQYLKLSIISLILTLILTFITGCNLLLSFGGDNKCRLTNVMRKPYSYNYFNTFELLEDCGFSKLCSVYQSNPKISYVNNYATNIQYYNGQYIVKSNNKINTFDKVIIACGYEGYRKIINLTQEEKKYLGATEYFNFYTTLVKPNNSQIDTNSNDANGHIKIKDAVLFGSNKPLNISPTNKIVKNFLWKMPIHNNQKRKQQLNDNIKGIYFIGKEMTDLNGVNFCMVYAKKIIDKYFK